MSSCHIVKIVSGLSNSPNIKLINIYIFIKSFDSIFILILTRWQHDKMTIVKLLFYCISISCKALQCIQRAVRPLFWWKNGRADGRKIPLFGVLRIVFGLQLSICGVVDLPILGSNLVKIGVQGAIFDKFWWSLILDARIRCEGASLVKMLRCWGVKVLTDSA